MDLSAHRHQPMSASADVAVIAGDSTSAYRAISRGQPMILLPFTAHQLDMSLRLERLGCGVIVHPTIPKVAASRSGRINGDVDNDGRGCGSGGGDDGDGDGDNADRCTSGDLADYPEFTRRAAAAIAALKVSAAPRVPFERNVAWLRSVLTSEGGVASAADYVETISQHSATVFLPYNEQLVWWKAAALDVYVVYVGVLLFLWLVTKTCVGAIWILWRNLAQADLTKLD